MVLRVAATKGSRSFHEEAYLGPADQLLRSCRRLSDRWSCSRLNTQCSIRRIGAWLCSFVIGDFPKPLPELPVLIAWGVSMNSSIMSLFQKMILR